jgi:hypothetical protein
VSEYLTYLLWRQREETLPRELERRRVAVERLAQQQLREIATECAEEVAEPAARPSEADLEFVN